MASLLTSTSLKSGFLYFGLVSLVFTGVIYFLFFQKPGVQHNFYRRAFELNYAAFNNGIRLANYRFIADRRKVNTTIDKWLDNNIGLDFNQSGFPIGTEVLVESQEQPATASDCREIWRFVLGPLKPAILFSASQTKNHGYWVQLTPEKVCIFRSTRVNNLEIHYDALKGSVTLEKSSN